MRINNNKGDITQSIRQDKIQNFPNRSNSEQVKSSSVRNKTGIVIDISDHARKIQSQNERILDATLSEEVSSERLAEINNRIKTNYYSDDKVIRKMVDNMFDNAMLIRT